MSAMKMKLNVFLVAFFAAVLIGEAANFQLPQPGPGGDMTLTQALKNRRTVREYELRELNQSELASLLWAACGVNRADGRRTAPTGLNVQVLTSWGGGPGVYHRMMKMKKDMQSKRLVIYMMTARDFWQSPMEWDGLQLN